MEQLIPVINKLQDVFNTIGTDPLDLPQIVVVGSQSSGKSSVLENIVGRDFLPRGSGIVTRRPLVLQLINLPWDGTAKSEEEANFSEWGEFLHKPNEMFYNFNEIREEIIRETERLTGKNKGISNIAIHLKIYSPHVLNLTLVDLPGVTKVPVGDQPPDIEQQIRRMCLQYIEKPNAIILAVTPANSDLANSDALQLAREVDPDGVRTIGVLTKVDIMDKGTDCMDILTGKLYPLKLGYIPIVNRSQQDIIADKPIRLALKHEAEFFANHPIYRSIANRAGTAYLARTLNKILMAHIRDCLPELKVKVNKMLLDAQLELQSYGDPMYDSKGSRILTKFASDYRDAIDGKLTDTALHELYGGARVNYIFTEVFGKCLNSINPTDGLTLNDIRTAIRNATGPRSALFVPEVAFEMLVKRQIARLEEPSLQCVELVYDELQRIISQVENKDLLRFTHLRERVVEVTNALLQRLRKPTREMVTNLINLEMAYINTNHPDFLQGGLPQVLEQIKQKQQQESAPPGWSVMSPPQSVSMANSVPSPSPAPSPAPASGKSATPSPAPVNPASAKDATFFATFFGGASKASAANSQSQSGKGSAPAPAPASAKGKQAPGTQPSSAPSAAANSAPHVDKLEQVPSSIRTLAAPTEKEQMETELIQALLVAYFDIVRKNFKDLVPKSVMCFLVNASKDLIQNELVQNLYKDELIDKLLEESPAIASRRNACKAMVDVLKKAHEIINEVRDLSLPQ